MRFYSLIVIFFAAASMSGCAHYEYDLTRPADLTGHIGTKVDQVFQRGPLEYRLRTVDNRLVMRIFNPTDSALTLLGQRSAAVDPSGQSHPLTTQTIAPQSFIKLILPPIRPRIQQTGPTFGIGVGTMIGSRRHRFYNGYSTIDDEPQYFAVYDDGNASYWDWNGESTARLTLVFEQGDKTLEHEFVIARRKM